MPDDQPDSTRSAARQGRRGEASHAELLAAFPDVSDPAATEAWLREPWLNAGAGRAPSADVSTAVPSPVTRGDRRDDEGADAAPAPYSAARAGIAASPVVAMPGAPGAPGAPGGRASRRTAAGAGADPGGRRPRTSRFDRPRPPRDWRWVVGGVGRVLISIGLLMFAFVAYQLWGTGIQTAQAQRRLGASFEELVAAGTTLPPPVTTAAAPPATPASAPAAAPAASAPTTEVAPSTAAPTTAGPSTTAMPALLERPPVGDLVAKIEIPSIGVDDYVVEGVTRDALKDGPGHFPASPFPGQLGNAAIAGHRTTYGAPFGDLDRVAVGDQIVVTTAIGRYVYVVTGTDIVRPSDYALVVPTIDASVASLTLVTCHPKTTAEQRLIVRSVLDPLASSLVTAPSPPPATDEGDAAGELPDELPLDELPGDELAGEGLPGSDEPADAAEGTDTDTETDTAGSDTAGSVAPSATTGDEPADEPADEPGDAAGVAPSTGGTGDADDAFEGGWFDDEGAIPHVALWGLALTAISIGAYLVSRAARRNWVGLLVGTGPFVVALYFWFENVNRLLPPGL